MKLNTDDTEMEQKINSMHLPTDVLFNCQSCKRLFYANKEKMNQRYDAGLPLLCTRCKNK